MYPSIKRIAGAAVVAALAIPGTALAHERPSVTAVKSHVRNADQALDKVAALVRDHEEAAAAIAFARNRREIQAADREARRLARRDARRGATALRAVARQHDDNAAGYVDLVDEAVDLQVLMAKATQSSFKGRDRAAAELTKLAERVPEPARAAIARALSAIARGGSQDVAQLSGAVSAPGVSPDAAAWLQLAAAQVTSGIDTAVEQLEGLVGTLPAPAQAHVQQALEHVRGALQTVSGILQGLFGGGSPTEGAAPSSSLPVPSGLPVPQIPLPQGLPIPGIRG